MIYMQQIKKKKLVFGFLNFFYFISKWVLDVDYFAFFIICDIKNRPTIKRAIPDVAEVELLTATV